MVVAKIRCSSAIRAALADVERWARFAPRGADEVPAGWPSGVGAESRTDVVVAASATEVKVRVAMTKTKTTCRVDMATNPSPTGYLH